MTRIISYIALFFVLLSCQKEIDLKYKDADPKPVFECMVNLEDTIHTLQITRSVSLNGVYQVDGVTGAQATLSDDLGNTTVFTGIAPGLYQSSVFHLDEGRTYTLNITLDGKTYTATSVMPYQVNLDDLQFLPGSFGGDSTRIIVPLRQDPAGVDNFYRFKVRINDEIDQSIMLQSDELSDGLLQQQPIFGSLTPKIGDTCTVTMFCIDENVYNYFFALLQNAPGGSATPANPPGNFSGDCLGYFSAQSRQSLTEVVE